MHETFYFIQALSPLHCSSGRGEGVIDLPIMREASTKTPLVPGSSIKGVLRDYHHARGDSAKVLAVFGPETDKASDFAGCCCFGDALLALLPVRSLCGVFAWATCPYILRRMRRDALDCGLNPPELPKLNENGYQALLCHGSALLRLSEKNAKDENPPLVLEDFDIPAKRDAKDGQSKDAKHILNVHAWAKWLGERIYEEDEWRELLIEHFAVIPDNLFSHLMRHRIEVNTRIRIDAGTKTVQDGALWTEEALPVDSVLWALLQAEKPHGKHDSHGLTTPEEVSAFVLPAGESLRTQLGGNATVGQGRVRLFRKE